jgi:2',3'-cyclic-nucleotide 2'-phosphodiesterase/3'-nucleotidase
MTWRPQILLSILLLCISTGLARAQTQRVQITILSTTDLHGNILPVDYYTNQPDARGLAKIATLIRQARKENPNLLLFDSGDTIQGTPLESYHNRKNNAPSDPMMLSMNALGYDAMTVGNHEYNFGLDVLLKAKREAKFPYLSANTYDQKSGQNFFQPYLVKEVDGVRIGILGLTTPGVPNWESPANYAGLEFRNPLAEAKKWVPVLRNKERVDLVVIAMHMGLEADLRTGQVNPSQITNENQAFAIAQGVPGVDLILMGHTHREVTSLFVHSLFEKGIFHAIYDPPKTKPDPSQTYPSVVEDALLVQASNWGRSLARVDIYLSKDKSGRWQILSRQARTIPVDDKTPVDPEIAGLAVPYDRETQAWLNEVVGTSSMELTAADAYLRDTAIMDLVQQVQLDAGKAEVSLAAPFNLSARIRQGNVTIRDLAGLYIYENTLVVVELAGQQLKDALEHSARFFVDYVPGKTAVELINPRIPGYNFDVAEGVTYDIDLSKPLGQRIQNLRYQGQPLDPKRKLRVAINNYRAGGGGGYTMFKDAPVLDRSSREIRDLIADWVEANHKIPTEPSNNWRIVTP